MQVNIGDLPANFAELVSEINRRGIYCRQIPKTVIIEARHGETLHFLSQYTLPVIPQNYAHLIDNKKNFKSLLHHLGIPYLLESQCFAPSDIENALLFANKIGFPVICKPVFGMNMFLVFCGIQTQEELTDIWQAHFPSLATSNNQVVVEKYVSNASDNRFVCFKDGAKVVLRRFKPQVIGDGHSTITELIDAQNTSCYPKAQIPTADSEVQRCLRGQGFSFTTIPSLGEVVSVHYATDVNKGGSFEVVNADEVHPSYWQLFHRVWEIFPKMPFFSLDILSTDLTLPTHEERTAINEASIGPALSWFFVSVVDNGMNLVQNLVDILFPGTRRDEESSPQMMTPSA